MAVAIVFYAGEGSNQREMLEKKELVTISLCLWTAPAVIREMAAEEFVNSDKFRAPKPDAEDYVDDMVIAAIIDDEGVTQTGEAYEAEYNKND